MPYKQAPKSAALKALVGNQKNLPEALKAKILTSPETPAKQARAFGRKIGSDKIEYLGPVTATEIPEDKVESGYIMKAAKPRKRKVKAKKGSEADEKTLKRMSSDKYKSPAKKYKKGC